MSVPRESVKELQRAHGIFSQALAGKTFVQCKCGRQFSSPDGRAPSAMVQYEEHLGIQIEGVLQAENRSPLARAQAVEIVRTGLLDWLSKKPGKKYADAYQIIGEYLVTDPT